jgi:hypothetical protein
MEFLFALLLLFVLLSICISIGKATELAVYKLVTSDEKRPELHICIEENITRHRVCRQPNPRSVRRKKK